MTLISQLKKMKRNTIILLFAFSFLTTGINARQTQSPLESSFQTYRQMKRDTKYKLDWISLGPVVNSARADVVQVDKTHPGTMYVGFGSGGLWKTVNNGVSWDCVFQEQASLGIGDMEPVSYTHLIHHFDLLLALLL